MNLFIGFCFCFCFFPSLWSTLIQPGAHQPLTSSNTRYFWPLPEWVLISSEWSSMQRSLRTPCFKSTYCTEAYQVFIVFTHQWFDRVWKFLVCLDKLWWQKISQLWSTYPAPVLKEEAGNHCSLTLKNKSSKHVIRNMYSVICLYSLVKIINSEHSELEGETQALWSEVLSYLSSFGYSFQLSLGLFLEWSTISCVSH